MERLTPTELSGTSAALQTFLLIRASYSHSTSTSLNSIIMLYELDPFFLFVVQEITTVMSKHQMTVLNSRAAILKVTCPPCFIPVHGHHAKMQKDQQL